ncbi:YXWGXW repeat-containing protein [bacterium]|nr:YXWGXW repeat-containing protein [bacterium]
MRSIFKAILLLTLVFSFFGCATYNVQAPPPPPKIEKKGPSPQSGMVWINGHWTWKRGSYVWISGHWVKVPKGGAVWAPGHWKKTGRGHRWVPGHWK